MKEWFAENSEWVAWIGGASVFLLVLSAVLLPVVINRMRADYFLDDPDPERSLEVRYPLWHALGMLGKNILGVFFLLMGIVMLITPGQGLLTILIGLLLMDFPGKRRFEIWLIRIPHINRAINWIRKKGDKAPLQLPETA